MVEEAHVLVAGGTIVNSYILYRETVGSPSSHADYRRQVVVSLCEQWPVRDVRRQLMRPSRDEERFQGRHYIARGQTRRRCIVCIAKGQRHETIYVCDTCTSNPPLCLDNCFRKYHECVNYRN